MCNLLTHAIFSVLMMEQQQQDDAEGLEDLIAAFTHPITGVRISDQRKHFRVYKEVFVGASISRLF